MFSSSGGQAGGELSDNYAKAIRAAEEIERYRCVFGTAGVINVPAIV